LPAKATTFCSDGGETEAERPSRRVPTLQQDRFPPGTVLGKYRIVRLIGAGGMGAVYEAAHVDLGKAVALKTLLAALETNREAQARFLTEGRASARIDHPHVVRVTDFGTANGTAFLVMELLQGENLGDKLARDRRMDAFEALDLLLPVMDALAEGHRLGIVHRDLKPQNEP
jgi:serine/threonine protein kinase